MNAFTVYLNDLATENPAAVQPADIHQIADPVAFTADLLRSLTANNRRGQPPTRNGINRMMDALLAHPSIAAAFLPPNNHENRQEDVAVAIPLADAPELLKSYWTHIIVPAWNQFAVGLQA